MLFTDTYKIIEKTSIGEFKSRGSRFVGIAIPIQSEDDFKQQLQQLKKDHLAAAHHCYAYILGPGKQLQKSSDDREPANTAGKPILRALLQADLTNIGIVVVRYFGGKLLGIPGLIEAYGAAAQAALENADIIEKTIMERYQVVGHFESENEYYKITKQMGLKIIHHLYNQSEFNSIFEVRKQQADEAVIKIKEKRLFTITSII